MKPVYSNRIDPDQSNIPTIYPKIFRLLEYYNLNKLFNLTNQDESPNCSFCNEPMNFWWDIALLEIESDWLGLIEQFHHFSCLMVKFNIDLSNRKNPKFIKYDKIPAGPLFPNKIMKSEIWCDGIYHQTIIINDGPPSYAGDEKCNCKFDYSKTGNEEVPASDVRKNKVNLPSTKDTNLHRKSLKKSLNKLDPNYPESRTGGH